MAAVLVCFLLFTAAAPALAQGGDGRVVLKLRDGSDAALERGELVARRTDLAPLGRVLREHGVARGSFRRTSSRSPEAIRAARARGERRSGRRLPDLTLDFSVVVPPGTDPIALAASLRALPLVESAQPWPKPAPPPFDIAPPTPDFTALQTYTASAPAGIGSADFVGVAGANGAGTRYVDIEFSWQLAHEDLELPPSAMIQISCPTEDDPFLVCSPFDRFMDWGSHGSAVLGILSARANGYGTTGLVPVAQAFVAPSNTIERGWDVGLAIEQALEHLSPVGSGDVVLLEQQAYVCGEDGSGGSQFGAGPVEWFDLWRDQILYATANGVTVIEAAGNGSLNLEDPACGGVFDRDSPAFVDSGAIFVTAGSAAMHAPLSYSNYGNRVDVQGIAEGITTLGGGALFGGSDVLQRYQSNFGGSSSASALVAGLVLSLHGMRIARGVEPLEPLELRDLLVQTGTPQAPSPKEIGPLPDLAAAHAVGVPPPPVSVLPVSGALALGALLFAGVALRARCR